LFPEHLDVITVKKKKKKKKKKKPLVAYNMSANRHG